MPEERQRQGQGHAGRERAKAKDIRPNASSFPQEGHWKGQEVGEPSYGKAHIAEEQKEAEEETLLADRKKKRKKKKKGKPQGVASAAREVEEKGFAFAYSVRHF